MLRYITSNNEQLPADFSLMTAVKIAKAYGTDITGISEIFSKLDDAESQLIFLSRVGAIALTEGSLRCAVETHIPITEAKRYTEYDVIDMLTVDMSMAEELTRHLSESFENLAVFQKPQATPVAPKTKKRKR